MAGFYAQVHPSDLALDRLSIREDKTWTRFGSSPAHDEQNNMSHQIIARTFRPKLSNSHVFVCLARGFSARSFRSFLFDLLPQKEGAERRKAQLISGGSLAESRDRSEDRSRPTALHCGVIRWWDPSASPACQSSLGSGQLTRRRDGRFHPRLHCEPGGLLHTSPEGRPARACARGAVPIHVQASPAETSLRRMGMRTM